MWRPGRAVPHKGREQSMRVSAIPRVELGLIPIALHDAFPEPAGAAMAVLLSLIPIAVGTAVLRYRLYDLDLVLNRALVYTILSAMTAAVYLAVVVLAGLVAGWGRGLAAQIVATGVAA